MVELILLGGGSLVLGVGVGISLGTNALREELGRVRANLQRSQELLNRRLMVMTTDKRLGPNDCWMFSGRPGLDGACPMCDDVDGKGNE